MGRKHIVPYALYRAEGYVSAHLADNSEGRNGTGFSENDLKLLWDALVNMFDHDHSAARGKMNARKLIVFKHDTALGNAPAHKLFDLVKVKRSADEPKPARAFSDYIVEIDRGSVPTGVILEEKI
jgi:CRISPR-associated protein Csd2